MMTAPTMPVSTAPMSIANRALEGSAVCWFSTVLIGQWIFAYYILGFYGGAAVQADLETWNERLFHGIVEGDLRGNAAVVVHLFLAFVITVSGPLQLIPHLRNRFPAFHRFNGRLYVATAITISVAGLYLIVARGGVSITGDISLGLNGLLVLLFAAIALRYAVARDIDMHRRWALRLFLAVSGFLFARLGFQTWIFFTGGLGHTNSFDGPFDVFWGFGNYLIPLALLELYLYTKNRPGVHGKYAMAGVLILVTVLMGVGIYLATTTLWLPATTGVE